MDTKRIIDLRSDTVTRPTDQMRMEMAKAQVGDDVFGDDPSVNYLESLVADLAGKESGLFLPTGTQSNLAAMLTHCGRGDELIAGANSHVFCYEAKGASVLGGIGMKPVTMNNDGSLDLEEIASAVSPDDPHFARTKLLCCENTHDGKFQAPHTLKNMVAVAKEHGLATHLDGARLWNAAVAQKTTIKKLAKHFDSVSLCLSKGLGAPVGSVLVSNSETIAEARRWRKVLGGGMRQAGIVAAGALWAIENGFKRLVEDHDNATVLASLIEDLHGIHVTSVNTNMVFLTFDFEALDIEALNQDNQKHLEKTCETAPANAVIMSYFKQRGVLIRVDAKGSCRIVTHRDVSRNDIKNTVAVFQEIVT